MEEMAANFSEAWKLAQDNIRKVQTRQKRNFDKRAKEPTYRVGERVFLYMPASQQDWTVVEAGTA